MDKINQDFITRLWETKYVSDPDENWFISKVFKTREQSLPIEEQKRLLDLKKIYFWEYIPETELVEIWDGYYFIKQKNYFNQVILL